MKLNNISFPYPVLGVNDDISPALTDNAVVIHYDKNDVNKYSISVSLRINNTCIEDLINQGFAKYVCEIDCPKTNLRHSVSYNYPDFSFDVNRRSVSGNVFLNCFVTVEKPIENYINPGFHEDYKGSVFNLMPGDILVGFPSCNFVADPKFDKLQSATSFMQIRQDEDNEYTNFELTERTIDIKLPPELFKIYNAGVGQSYSEVIHSSLAYNALLGALYEINNYPSAIWAQALIKLMHNTPEIENYVSFDDDGKLECHDMTMVATILLKDPYNRMLHKLSQTTFDTTDFDD